MKYMGSKNRIASEILPFILQDQTKSNYVEPFVGGANMIDKIPDKYNKIGSDKNHYLIAMFQGLQSNETRPYKITKDIYDKARDDCNKKTNTNYNDFLIGWIGFMASFNGRFFDGGYCGSYEKRDYIGEQIRNTEKQIESIKTVEFQSNNYSEINIPDNSIIYCDPPYQDTKQYNTSKDFNHTEFWEWCREQSRKGHKVYISEYNAPDDFTLLWEKKVKTAMNPNATKNSIEKLYTYGATSQSSDILF